MNKKLLSVVVIAFFFLSISVIPQITNCQTVTPKSTVSPTPTEKPEQGNSLDLLLVGGIVAVVAVAVGVTTAFIIFKKRTVNEKSLKKISAGNFEDWVIKKFNGKTSDPTSGVNGFTAGGQPLLIIQSDHVSLAEVEGFVKVLAKGKAQKGAIVAFDFDNDSLEGRLTAMDNGIELQLLRINELLNKRYSSKIESLAREPVTFETPSAHIAEDQIKSKTETPERIPNEPGKEGLKPRVFVSNSNTKVADQVKRMLDFLHYEYVMGGKEETTVPIPDSKFGLMEDCDCAIINISAIEQERRYSGLYILNSNVTSEINAAYLKYNRQIVLLVERKVELPPNLKGLKRIEYDTDDLSLQDSQCFRCFFHIYRTLCCACPHHPHIPRCASCHFCQYHHRPYCRIHGA